VSITYRSLARHIHLLLKLAGLEKEEFNRIAETLEPIYSKRGAEIIREELAM
jgi:hypothetical protein